MTRIKEFDSTGTAPLGRLYAGDLLAMQDAWADLTNLAQTVSLGTLKIGETGLQLLRYGAGEARLTGMLRVDEILRGLGGIVGGTFTTTERNAIAAGKAPYGLVILNTTTNQYEWNSGTDEARVWVALATPPALSVVDSMVAAISASKIGSGGSEYSPNIVGWSGTPQSLFRSTQLSAKLYKIDFYIRGTSNSTVTSFSIPTGIGNMVNPGYSVKVPVLAIDDGAVISTAYAEFGAGSVTITFAKSLSGQAWTGSGVKHVQGQIVIEVV